MPDMYIGKTVSQRRLRSASHPTPAIRLQSDRDDRCQDSRRHFPFVAHAALSAALLAVRRHRQPRDRRVAGLGAAARGRRQPAESWPRCPRDDECRSRPKGRRRSRKSPIARLSIVFARRWSVRRSARYVPRWSRLARHRGNYQGRGDLFGVREGSLRGRCLVLYGPKSSDVRCPYKPWGGSPVPRYASGSSRFVVWLAFGGGLLFGRLRTVAATNVCLPL